MGIEQADGCPQNCRVNPKGSEEGREIRLAGRGLQIWGDIHCKADSIVEGVIQGSVRGKEKVIVAAGTTVSGSVDGSDVRVEGQVDGGVTATGQLWIGPQAKVSVRGWARAIRIERGADFQGELQVG